jgi:hypothetical protein
MALALSSTTFWIGPEVDNLRRLHGQHTYAHVVNKQVLSQSRVEVWRIEQLPVGLQFQPATLLNFIEPTVRLAVGVPEFTQVSFIEHAEPSWPVKDYVGECEALALDLDR